MEKYSAGEFEVHPEIPDPRRKIKLALSSSWPVSKMAPDRS